MLNAVIGVSAVARKVLSMNASAINVPMTAIRKDIANNALVLSIRREEFCSVASMVVQATIQPSTAAIEPLTTVKLKLTAQRLEPIMSALKLVGRKWCSDCAFRMVILFLDFGQN